MNVTTTPEFTEFETEINAVATELDRLVEYCETVREFEPHEALNTVTDLEGQIKDAAALVRAHVAIFKSKARKVRVA